jgi:hypothetical protein
MYQEYFVNNSSLFSETVITELNEEKGNLSYDSFGTAYKHAKQKLEDIYNDYYKKTKSY